MMDNQNLEFVFEIGGRRFFKFSNMNNMPPLRGLKTMVFYTEMQMKTTFEYLEYHTQATESILMKDRINIFDIKKLNDQLKERLTIAADIELMLKVASIIIVDENEDIMDYDFDYNAKKIAYWKKHQGMDFFLNAPIQELFPILKDMNGSLEMYSKVLEQKNAIDMDSLLQHLPADVKQKLRSKYFSSQAATPLT